MNHHEKSLFSLCFSLIKFFIVQEKKMSERRRKRNEDMKIKRSKKRISNCKIQKRNAEYIYYNTIFAVLLAFKWQQPVI